MRYFRLTVAIISSLIVIALGAEDGLTRVKRGDEDRRKGGYSHEHGYPQSSSSSSEEFKENDEQVSKECRCEVLGEDCYVNTKFRECEKANITTLKFLHVIWRHGDRTPSDPTFKTDTENQGPTWPQGFGELTTIGMRQQYELGKYLRFRYDTYLATKYWPYEIYIRSTSYNRTLMSALSNLAGMYEPKVDQRWNDAVPNWQPVPVHSQPREHDPMLYQQLKCPLFDTLFNAFVATSKELKDAYTNYASLLTFIGQKTGLNRTPSLFNPSEVNVIWDQLNSQLSHPCTHKWPSWVNAVIFKQISELNDLTGRLLYPTLEIQRLRGGLLLGDLISRMTNQSTVGLSNGQFKYYAYSAHDTTIHAVMNNLESPLPHVPPYAAAIIFELHQLGTEFYVETYYRNDTSRAPYVVDVGGCPRPCTLAQFTARSQSRIPTNWYAECGYTTCNQL